MIVIARTDRFLVAEPDDFTRFHLDASQVTADELAVLIASSSDVAAHEKADHVWVSTSFLGTELAVGSHPARARGLEAMLTYAAKKGWVDAAGSKVAAHIERSA